MIRLRVFRERLHVYTVFLSLTLRYVCTEFFPTSHYQPCGVEIEAYPSDDVMNPDYTCELWIAVEKI